MGHFLAGLREALPQFLHVASLTSAFKRVGILAYYDYSDPAVTSWSGWCNPTHPASAASLIAFAETIDCSGGGGERGAAVHCAPPIALGLALRRSHWTWSLTRMPAPNTPHHARSPRRLA